FMYPNQCIRFGLIGYTVGKQFVYAKVMCPMGVIEFSFINERKNSRPEGLLGKYTIKQINVLFWQWDNGRSEIWVSFTINRWVQYWVVAKHSHGFLTNPNTRSAVGKETQ